MSKSSQAYYEHCRQFEEIERAEQMYLIEQSEYLYEITEGNTRKNKQDN